MVRKEFRNYYTQLHLYYLIVFTHWNHVPTNFTIVPSSIYYEQKEDDKSKGYLKVWKNYLLSDQQIEEDFIRENAIMYEHLVLNKNVFENPDHFAWALLRGWRAEIEFSNRNDNLENIKKEAARRWASILFKHRFNSSIPFEQNHIYSREVVEYNMHWFEHPKSKDGQNYPFVFKQYPHKKYDFSLIL